MNRKHVVFLAQAEPLFVPQILQILIDTIPQFSIAVGFFSPASTWKSFKREYINRLLYYGPIDFVRIACLYLWKKLTKPSLETLAERRSIPLIKWKFKSL